MKTSLILFSLFFLSCISDTSSIDTNKGLSVYLDIRGIYYASENKNCFFDFILTDVHITNSTSSSIKFWVYSCFYNLNFLLNNNDYSIIYNTCDANSPELFELKPNQTFSVPLIIKNNDLKRVKWSDFKIGFIMVHENQNDFKCDLEQTILGLKEKGEQIIWSNNIDIHPPNLMPIIINP
jgi:hypothetical protein